jgi:hypothetical protein
LSDREFANWAARKRVFISSVIEGMEHERQALADAVSHLGAEPVWFEEFGGRDQDAEQAYLAEVASSDIYIAILGSHYGRQHSDTGYSATHAEYLHAVDRGLRISVWVIDVDDMAGHQRDFLNEVRTYFTTESVDSPERLAERIGSRLKVIAAEDLAPWCKIGNIVFRASEIRDDGTTITITASVRDDDVAHALTGLRSEGFTGRQILLVTFGDTVATARVNSIESTVTAGATKQIIVTFTRENQQGSNGFLRDVSYNVGGRTYSPDELTEIAIREVLFGEPNPLEHGSGLTEIDDPVGPLRVGVAEETLRPILRLLLIESLVASGRASRITKLLVGPRTRGGRRLLLEWEPPSRYGQASPRQRVEGNLNL